MPPRGSALPGSGRLADGTIVDGAVAVALGLLVLVAHDVAYLLRTPYWLDESWVAVSTQLPLSDAALASGPSPFGWTLLLRAIPDFAGAGDQRHRLVPLAFAGIAVGLAFGLLRSLDFRRLASATAGGLVVLIVPAMTVRNDLKQYTADAAVVLLLLVLLSGLEAQWSRRRLWTLGAAVAVSPLLSSAAAFAGSAAFLALAITCALTRSWQRLRDVCVAGAAAGAVLMAILLTTMLRNSGAAELRRFWVDAYLSPSPLDAAGEVLDRASALAPFTGVSSLLLCAVLTTAGLLGIARSGRAATALLLPLAAIEAAIAAMLRVYPFLDLRVSAWLLTSVALVMAVGVAGMLRALVVRSGHSLPLRIILAAAAAAAITGYVHASAPQLRSHTVFAQDVRSQVSHLRAHALPGDVVIVTLSATWAYAYYDDDVAIRAVRSRDVATGFVISYPDDARIVAMSSRGPAAITDALARARALASSGSGRIWIVRTQVAADEQPTWTAFTAQCGVLVLDVGVDPLLLQEIHAQC